MNVTTTKKNGSMHRLTSSLMYSVEFFWYIISIKFVYLPHTHTHPHTPTHTHSGHVCADTPPLGHTLVSGGGARLLSDGATVLHIHVQ